MYFVFAIALLGLYLGLFPKASSPELQWMLGIFLATGYAAGFIDSRWLLKKDQTAQQQDKVEIETSNVIDPSDPNYYFENN